MKNQVFDKDGMLIEEIETNETHSPNITGFITQMMINPGYQQLVITSPSAMISRLETLMIRLENRINPTRADIEVIKHIWDYLISNLESNDFITSWKELASINFMPFTFNSKGELEINPDF